ncbi:rhodanese-like domain-containing protein [Alphaproteobacteria bacterium]|nr:rhodanese-like domain-containing protein [Alphaproteobacteria bacterium]
MVKKIIFIFLLTCFAKSNAFAETIDINNDEIKKLIKNNVPIVDIRTSDEWNQTGVIPNSILLTFFKKNGTYNFETWHKELGYVIDTNKPYVLICRSGRRTKIVSEMINKKIDKLVYNASFGINSWLQSNLKVVKP